MTKGEAGSLQYSDYSSCDMRKEAREEQPRTVSFVAVVPGVRQLPGTATCGFGIFANSPLLLLQLLAVYPLRTADPFLEVRMLLW